ncbi:MAG TPA: hypothetical protein VGI22_02300, partial [Xanthobacteraceae bacterium]
RQSQALQEPQREAPPADEIHDRAARRNTSKAARQDQGRSDDAPPSRPSPNFQPAPAARRRVAQHEGD